MRVKLKFVKLAVIAGGLALLLTPSQAFAHDNIGGDELAVANWMLISALVVAVMGILALLWAVRAGQFTNVEESKYTMLELSDDYDAVMAEAGARQRAATEAANDPAARKSTNEGKAVEAAAAKPDRAGGTARI